MSRDKQLFNDLVEFFDEEYGRRNLITPQNTAEKLTDKCYRKTSDIAREIFEEIESISSDFTIYGNINIVILSERDLAFIKKKYTEEVK